MTGNIPSCSRSQKSSVLDTRFHNKAAILNETFYFKIIFVYEFFRVSRNPVIYTEESFINPLYTVVIFVCSDKQVTLGLYPSRKQQCYFFEAIYF